MGTFTEHALNQLKVHGFRITKPRRFVVELLEETDKPLSAYEIKDKLLEKGGQIDTVSVYRILDCLEKNKLIHRVLSTGKVTKCDLGDEDHCHLEQDNHCHHLLICKGCEHIQEIHCPETMSLMGHLSTLKNFTITGHNLEFTGLCRACA